MLPYIKVIPPFSRTFLRQGYIDLFLFLPVPRRPRFFIEFRGVEFRGGFCFLVSVVFFFFFFFSGVGGMLETDLNRRQRRNSI